MKFILILAILEGIIQLSKGDGYCKGFEWSEIKQNIRSSSFYLRNKTIILIYFEIMLRLSKYINC